MNRMFEESLDRYYEQASREIRDFIGKLACDGIGNLSPGFVASRTTDRLCLGVPTIDTEATSKDLQKDGTAAVYTHKLANGDSLRFRPSNLQIGGWDRTIDYGDDFLEIKFRANTNPPSPRERHKGIIEQIAQNAAALAREIGIANDRLLNIITPEFEKRKAECADIERRRADL